MNELGKYLFKLMNPNCEVQTKVFRLQKLKFPVQWFETQLLEIE
jgi:hypothetical protein